MDQYGNVFSMALQIDFEVHIPVNSNDVLLGRKQSLHTESSNYNRTNADNYKIIIQWISSRPDQNYQLIILKVRFLIP